MSSVIKVEYKDGSSRIINTTKAIFEPTKPAVTLAQRVEAIALDTGICHKVSFTSNGIELHSRVWLNNKPDEIKKSVRDMGEYLYSRELRHKHKRLGFSMA